MIPDGLPVLSIGSHKDAQSGACVMEYISLLAGEEWSDYPACTAQFLAHAAQTLNDSIAGSDRRGALMLPLVPKLMGTGGHDDTAPTEVFIRLGEDMLDAFGRQESDSPIREWLAETRRRYAEAGLELIPTQERDLMRDAIFYYYRAYLVMFDKEVTAGVIEFMIDRYEVHMGDIGEPVRRIEVIPVPEPNEAPVKEPSPQTAPSTPAPEREPVPV